MDRLESMLGDLLSAFQGLSTRVGGIEEALAVRAVAGPAADPAAAQPGSPSNRRLPYSLAQPAGSPQRPVTAALAPQAPVPQWRGTNEGAPSNLPAPSPGRPAAALFAAAVVTSPPAAGAARPGASAFAAAASSAASNAPEWDLTQLEGEEQAPAAPVAQAITSAVIFNQVAQRTEAWQQLRSGRITASAFAAVIGYQFGKTGQDGLKNLQGVWREKMGVQRPEPDWYGRNAMEYGTRNEPNAAAAYTQLTGQELIQCGFAIKSHAPEMAWYGASPDGMIAQPAPDDPLATVPGLLEIKCPFKAVRWPNTFNIPDTAEDYCYYMAQVQGQMEVLNLPWCNLFVWSQKQGCGLYHIRRDAEFWAMALDILAWFWWGSVVPARAALDDGVPMSEVEERFLPRALHPRSQRLIDRGKALAAAAPNAVGTYVQRMQARRMN